MERFTDNGDKVKAAIYLFMAIYPLKVMITKIMKM